MKRDIKFRLIEKLIHTDDDAILKQVESILEGNDYWENLPGEVKKAIDQAVDEGDRGQGDPHQKVMKEFRDKYL